MLHVSKALGVWVLNCTYFSSHMAAAMASKTVFGVSLNELEARSGQHGVPAFICDAIKWIEDSAMHFSGLWQVEGHPGRIDELQHLLDVGCSLRTLLLPDEHPGSGAISFCL